MAKNTQRDETLCVTHPQAPLDGFASFSVPVYRASTIIYPNADAFRNRGSRGLDGYTYGLFGTPTTRALEHQLSVLHKAERTLLVPSGQAAISMVMLAILQQHDHLLIPDNVYPPVKQFARDVLGKLGIEVDVFDPTDLVDLQRRIRPGVTKLIWLESPGSTSMEVCDMPEIAQMAHDVGALVGCDNTWATALLCKPLTLGVDIVAEALTKYVSGHSDILLGSISVSHYALYEKIENVLGISGVGVSPDTCSLALRGIETMALRLRHVEAVAYDFACKLTARPGIAAVLHPALPANPGYAFWRRDFTGSSGVFTLRIDDASQATVDQALDSLQTFSIGFSWGGTHSLVVPMALDNDRERLPVAKGATYLRFSIGLEAPEALWRDLDTLCTLLAQGQ